MGAVEDLLGQPPYARTAGEHGQLLRAAVREALEHHCTHCPPFARWYARQGADPAAEIHDLSAVPFLPVSIFKRLRLASVDEHDIVRVLKSSATSSQIPSQVVLDRVTRDRQMRTLAVLLSALMGPKRRPFIVLDAAAAQTSEVELSARIAGLRGYLMMASETHYALGSDSGQLTLDPDVIGAMLHRFRTQDTPVCLIGYTYILHQHVVAPMLRAGVQFVLPPGSMVLHFGGWKRLQQRSVGRARLNAEVAQVFGVEGREIRDVYGFTEQLGVIYPDDGDGVRTAPVYAEVVVRDPVTLEAAPDGVPGLLEFICPLPNSYPGIALLLDDMGRIISRDEPHEGRFGTRFEVLGRAAGAEIRGCGDTLHEQVYEVRAETA